MSSPLLKVDQLGIQFGGLKAVQNVDLHMNHGELIGLIKNLMVLENNNIQYVDGCLCAHRRNDYI